MCTAGVATQSGFHFYFSFVVSILVLCQNSYEIAIGVFLFTAKFHSAHNTCCLQHIAIGSLVIFYDAGDFSDLLLCYSFSQISGTHFT